MANLFRLKNLMRRARQGEELTIGFLGGSITQGSLASEPQFMYARRVFAWWEKTFPQAKLHFVNGGIGGTTSHYGVARAVTDVLMYQPDIVTVDFSVNDDPDPFFEETYEGLIRRLLKWKSRPAVLLLNNVFYDTGVNAEAQHNPVADHYGVPHVSIRDTVWRRLQSGEFQRADISPDGLHPNDRGHALVAGELIRFLEKVLADVDTPEPEESELPPPLTANAYEQAQRLTIREISPDLAGFRADTDEKTGMNDHFKNGWIGRTAGDSIRFSVEAACIAVQFRRTIRRPACKAIAVLDGDETGAVLLDGNFDEDWGDALVITRLLHHGEKRTHTIELRITEGGEEKTPFYLLSVIVA